jgi:hypothetical protein
MSKTSKSDTQARLAKEKAERDAKMAKQKADRGKVDFSRLENIGREIKVRVGKLDQLGGKAVDMLDSINHLLADAEKLCSPAGFTFEAFKKTYCPQLGQSRTYELLAIQEGRKSLEEIRADTRKRVTKHRAAAKQEDVTENDSVTSDLAERTTIDFPENGGGSQPVLMASADKSIEEVREEFAELAGETPKPPAAIAGSDEIDANARKAADEAMRAAETPTEAAAEPPSTNGHVNKPDDDRPLAEKLHYALNDVWSLCQDKNNWPPLGVIEKKQLNTAMKLLRDLRELLPTLATPKSKPVVH